MENPFYIQSISCAGFVVGAAFQVCGTLPSPSVVNYSRIALTDRIYKIKKGPVMPRLSKKRNILQTWEKSLDFSYHQHYKTKLYIVMNIY